MLELLKENLRAKIDTPSLPNTCPLFRKARSAWRWRYMLFQWSWIVDFLETPARGAPSIGFAVPGQVPSAPIFEMALLLTGYINASLSQPGAVACAICSCDGHPCYT